MNHFSATTTPMSSPNNHDPAPIMSPSSSCGCPNPTPPLSPTFPSLLPASSSRSIELSPAFPSLPSASSSESFELSPAFPSFAFASSSSESSSELSQLSLSTSHFQQGPKSESGDESVPDEHYNEGKLIISEKDVYTIGKPIGKGGYGIVYKATGHGGRLFAIKQGRKEKGRKAIKEEGRILKVVGGHRNIVAMYDEFHYGGQRLLVLEFAARGDLRGLLLQKGLLGEPETAAIGRSMINGIMHMHEVGYLHRDLKPENILLGEDNTVVIADFGMALDFWNERCRGAYGTNGYRAPETVRKKPHSPSMDVWSFGIIIYEMLTGVNPKMVVDEDVNDISPWENLTVSDGAKAVLAGALAVECGSRLSLSELLQLKFFNMKNPVVTTTTITEVHTQSVPKRKLSQPESSDDEASKRGRCL